MAARVKKDEGEPKFKYRYRVTNWAEYDRALVARGSLTLWFEEARVREQWTPRKVGSRGAPRQYSEVAIQTLLTLKVMFRLPYRATEGLAQTLMKLNGLDLPVPDHSHLSRRAEGLKVSIARRERSEPMHLVIDSTGLKVYGEGEWKVRLHGVGKRRTWRKVHLAIDESAKDIVAVEVTTTDWADCEVAADLMTQAGMPIDQVSGDGAYDTEGVHAAVTAHGARATIPPREGAVPWGNDHPRDRILAAIQTDGAPAWKKASGYHRRSLAENMMYRLKQLGDRLFSRRFARQVNEVHIRVAILNRFTYLGMPVSVRGSLIPSAA